MDPSPPPQMAEAKPSDPPPPPPSPSPPPPPPPPPSPAAAPEPPSSDPSPSSFPSNQSAPTNPNPPQSQEQTSHPQSQPQPLHPRLTPSIPRPRASPPSTTTTSSPIQNQSPSPRVGMAMGVPAPFSSFRPSHPFAAPFPSSSSSSSSFPHHPPWAGGPDQLASSSASQVRQPVQGVQPIGMIGSLSNATATNQIRTSAIPGQSQPRLGQPQVRSTSQSANQTKFPTHGVPRAPSMASTSSQSPAPQSSPSLQQQWMLTHGRQTPSVPPSSSYRSPIKQPITQQRPHHVQQQNVPVTSHQASTSQQQQQQGSVPNQSQEKLLRNQQPFLPQQQQPPRAQVPTTSKSNLALAQPGLGTPTTHNEVDESSKDIINRKRIRELVTQVDQSEKLRPEIEDDLLEIADDFIESIVTAACQLAKHRKSTILEAKDMLLHVERHWNMALPGFTGDEIKCYKKTSTNDIHRERVAMIKKSMVGMNEGGSAKNLSLTGGQASANPKAHASKAPAMGSP